MKEEILPVSHSKNDCYYTSLIEAVDGWQQVFELAFDHADGQLDEELFPVQQLRFSLREMCDLLRDVLAQSVPQPSRKDTANDELFK